MRSPSPRRRYSNDRKRNYHHGRSRSRSRGRGPRSGSSLSPKQRRRSPPRRSPPRRHSGRSRSPRRLSGHSGERFEPKPLQMDRPQTRPLPTNPPSPIPTKTPALETQSSDFNPSPNKPGRSRLSDPAIKADFDPYRDNSGGHGDKDYRPLMPPSTLAQSRTKERFDQTTVSINDRFLDITGPKDPVTPTENITIAIERNIPGSEPAIIRREIYPQEVIIVRRKDEGVNALFRRAEFLGPKEEYLEKRTIKVSEDNRRGSSEVNKPLLTDRWMVRQQDNSPEMYKKQGMSREELDRFILDTPIPTSSRHGDRDDRVLSRDRGSQGGMHADRDERVVLDKHERRDKMPDSYKFTVKIDQSLGDFDLRDTDEKSKFERDPKDLRHNLTKKKDKEEPGIDIRQKLLKKREYELRKREEELKRRSAMLERKEREILVGSKKEDDLPDFSNRPDKFPLQPEVIPKGSYYYEHDNRDDVTQMYRGRGRGRGRAMFRSRGARRPYRGFSYRGASSPRREFIVDRRGPSRGAESGFPGYSGQRRDSANREWKHDKFEEIEDEKPTSTTKN